MEFEQLVRQLDARYPNANRQEAPNHWLFEVATGDGRSQVVHLMLKEKWLGERNVSRFIVESPIGPIRGRYNYEEFLRRNAELDVGAVCIRDLRDDENLVVPYLTLRATRLVSTAGLEDVQEMIELVAYTADEIEKDLYARDLH